MNNEYYCGLANHGNTCFFNSAMQSIMRCSVFINFISNLEIDDELIIIMKDFINDYKKNSNGSISLSKLVKYYTKLNPDYSIGSQDDGDEVIVKIIGRIDDIIKKEIKEDRLKNSTIKGEITVEKMMEYLFGVKIRTTTKCTKCNNSSIYEVVEFMLKLPIKGDTVEELLKNYSKIEQMTGDEQYYCNKCEKKVDALKIDTVMKTPKYLHLNIKRFGFNKNFTRSTKNDQTIVFKPDLTICNNTYNLRGIVHHMGSYNGGHYIYNYNKNKNTSFEDWICLDDSRISTKNVINEVNKGYVYLYVK